MDTLLWYAYHSKIFVKFLDYKCDSMGEEEYWMCRKRYSAFVASKEDEEMVSKAIEDGSIIEHIKGDLNEVFGDGYTSQFSLRNPFDKDIARYLMLSMSGLLPRDIFDRALGYANCGYNIRSKRYSYLKHQSDVKLMRCVQVNLNNNGCDAQIRLYPFTVRGYQKLPFSVEREYWDTSANDTFDDTFSVVGSAGTHKHRRVWNDEIDVKTTYLGWKFKP